MLIGLSTAILWDYKELNLPEAIFRSIQGMGYEAVEIHCEDPLFKGWGTKKAEITKKEVKEALSTLDAEVTLHAPFHDLNTATLNKGARDEVIRQHRECLETARYLNSNIVVVHPGFVSSRKYRREVAFEQMISTLRKMADIAEDNGVKVCLENLASKRKAMCVEIPELKEVLDRINRDNFRLTLDIAHANTTKVGPLEYARELKDHISHVHVSDNTGEDSHLTLGQGNIDFEGVLKELHPFDNTLIVEGWIPTDEDPFLKKDLRELKRIRESLKS